MRLLLAFSLLLGVFVAPLRADSLAPPQRAAQVWAQSLAAYKQLRTFSIETHETLFQQGRPRTDVRFQAAMGAPTRAFLRGQSAKPFRPTPKLLRGDALIYPTDFGVVRHVHTPQNKRDLGGYFQSVFEESQLHILAVALSENMDSSDWKNVKEMHESPQEIRFVLRNDAFVQEWTFDSKTSFLTRLSERRVRADAKTGLTRYLRVTKFSLPKSNWRGSWTATDAAVYNVAHVFGKRTVAEAIAQRQIQIEPKARAIFERAAALYAKAQTVSLQIEAPETDENSKKTLWHLDFERATNRWRFRWVYGFHVANGRQIWGTRHGKYAVSPQNPQTLERFKVLLYESPVILWAEMIWGEYPVSEKALKAHALARNLVDVRVVAPVQRDGVEFQRVRVAITNRYAGQTKPFVTFYDFDSNGALAAGFGGESDEKAANDPGPFIAIKQEFNQPIPVQNWAFYPPRGTERTHYPDW